MRAVPDALGTTGRTEGIGLVIDQKGSHITTVPKSPAREWEITVCCAAQRRLVLHSGCPCPKDGIYTHGRRGLGDSEVGERRKLPCSEEERVFVAIGRVFVQDTHTLTHTHTITIARYL